MDKNEALFNLISDTKSVSNNINELYRTINVQLKMKYDVLIYNLVKSGKVGPKDIAEAGYMSRTSVYDTVDRVDKLLETYEHNNN